MPTDPVRVSCCSTGTVGLSHVKAVHFNDSKVALGSEVDRHWHIGQGMIGNDGLRRVVNHPSLNNVPFILETPRDSEDADRENIEVTRRLSQETESSYLEAI
jgi:deoxyribonuclease-4